jgi:hypothetical protein
MKNSPHQSYKTLEVKPNEEERQMKDSRMVEQDTKIAELTSRISELEAQL